MSDIEIMKSTTVLTRQDKLGAIKVRLGLGRNNYQVSPGLYALGMPDPSSPVLVTANYKLTYDTLRSHLTGQNLWILVLDTKGINVWCAAGKGTFGTTELIRRIKITRLEEVVLHRNLILPQLGAPGVMGYKVTKDTGFKITYGPIRAEDIPTFLANGMKATDQMRRVTFTLKERLMVVPVEVQYAVKLLPALFVILVLFNLVTPNPTGTPLHQSVGAVLRVSFYQLLPHIMAFLLGTLGIAAFLPYLPGKSFALKGLFMGVLWSGVIFRFAPMFYYPESQLIVWAHVLIATAITTFFSLNFTGSTTFTSPSGVQKETLISIPIIALSTLVGFAMLIVSKVLQFK